MVGKVFSGAGDLDRIEALAREIAAGSREGPFAVKAGELLELVGHTRERLNEQAQILDHIHESVITMDLDGYIASWNPGAERLFGYTAAEAVGRHILFLYASVTEQ